MNTLNKNTHRQSLRLRIMQGTDHQSKPQITPVSVSVNLNVCDLIFCNHLFCFDLPLLVLTNWNETMWMVSWLSPLSCYYVDHCKGSQVLSLIAHECSNASWNETLHQSLWFLFAFKIYVFCLSGFISFLW